MNDKGWISLHRGITEHWIWDDAVKLKWWLDILLSVNHTPQKVLIGGKLVNCGRGQSALSLQSWSKRWLVSKDTVRNFIKLLESDDMIQIENITVSTLITVCNYDEYQIPINTPRKIKEKPTDNEGWKTDFQIYHSQLKESFDALITDISYIQERERYHPNLDIRLTLEKSFNDFWGTEAGWKNKKKSRSKNLDWKSTFNNALTQKMNQVYKKNDLFSTPPKYIPPKTDQIKTDKQGNPIQ